jgi:hypothetical protein
MKNNESVIAKQAVAQLAEYLLGDDTGQQLVAQLIKISRGHHINLLLWLTLKSLKTIIIGNIPAKPIEFDLSNFMLKLCGFSFFSALLTSFLIKSISPHLNDNQWRLM